MKTLTGSLFLLIFSIEVLADYDNGMRYAFVASETDKSVSIVDLHDQRTAETIKLELAPGVIEASNRLKALIIAHPTASRLTLVDLTSDKLKQIPYELDMVPDHIKLSPIGDTVAVYDKAQELLQIYNLRRRQILLKVENINSGDLLTFNRDGQQIFWVDRSTGQLKVSDLWSKTDEVKLTGDGAGLSAMTRSVDGSLGFISDANAGKVYVVNLRSMKLIRQIRTGNGPGRAWGTADGQYMIVPNYRDNTITAISTFSLQPMFNVNTTEKPVAVNTGWLDTTAAVIGETGEVALINLESRKIMKKFKIHGDPRAGVVTSNSRTFALPVSGNGDLFLFDMKSLLLEERITGLPKDIGQASLAISNNLCH